MCMCGNGVGWYTAVDFDCLGYSVSSPSHGESTAALDFRRVCFSDCDAGVDREEAVEGGESHISAATGDVGGGREGFCFEIGRGATDCVVEQQQQGRQG